ncbi:MAG: hypothetical protein M1825_000373 [Sarcosagium campestre]|nr:MAG: hypothetical protein M1825_000373 [Sarcosagium campestre]
MALTSWKTFNFFDVSRVKPRDDDESTFVFETSDISCVCSGSDNLFIGSSDGVVRILSQSFKVIRSFIAHNVGAITHMKQVEGTALLVTISVRPFACPQEPAVEDANEFQEDLSNEPVLKVWALDKTEKKTGTPTCQSTITIHNGRKQFPISAFAALDDLSQLAVGFANGSVVVVRGDLIHDRGTKQRTVFESQEPVTGVAFRDASKLTTLYLATTARILTLVISGRGQGQPARTLEDSGCGVDCMTVDPKTGDVVVVREDAIYYYTTSGRGPCYAFEGPKRLVRIFKDFVALVSPPGVTSISKSNALRGVGVTQAEDILNTSTFSLLDTDLKFVAHSETLSSQVKHVFVEWGDLFLLTVDGKLFRYREKSLQQKLEALYQRNLYVLAISIAQKARADTLQQNIIFRKFGDYLYQKGDFDGSMQQYMRAIDSTEPSQIIRKFLDTQRMHNLIEYLEELHEHHKATSDHTTLLLNCYAKLKDTEKLESFIRSPGDLKFDLDTAISMCRQGGYFAQAAYLATKHGEHDLVVTILVEDAKQYTEALQYIRRLDPDTAYANLKRYAQVLLEHCPEDATRLFVDYYTGHYRPQRETVTAEVAMVQNENSTAMQNLAALLPLPYMNASTPIPGSKSLKPSKPALAREASTEDPQPETQQYTAPKPRTAFSSFVDHPDEFIQFLEACLQESGLTKEDKTDLYTTLFEMYLHKASGKKGEQREEWETKAKRLIDREDIPIDTSNVMLLSHLSNFTDGTTLVREKQGLRFDIFRSYTSAKDTRGAIKALKKYGPEEPRLYTAALAYFTSSPQILEEAGDELDAVLRKIDEDRLMAPLQVIQTLSVNAVASMGMVKKYLKDMVDRERKEISNNRRLIESYRSETEAKRTEIADLGSKPTVFQAKRCSACGGSLDLPTVHFLCKHSFHQRCLNQVEGSALECPLCAGQNATIKAIRRAQDESADRHDMFKDALQRSDDKFGTISEFFGRGVMSARPID